MGKQSGTSLATTATVQFVAHRLISFSKGRVAFIPASAATLSGKLPQSGFP